MREGPGNLGLEERVAAEGAWHVQDLGQDQSGKPWPKERKGFRFSLFLLCLEERGGVAAGGWLPGGGWQMAEGCGDWREPGWRLGSFGRRRRRKDRLPSFCLLVPLPRACLSYTARALKRPLGTAVMLVPAGSCWDLCQDGPLLDPAGNVQYLRVRVLVPDGLAPINGTS